VRGLQELSAHRSETLAKKLLKESQNQIVMCVGGKRFSAAKFARQDVVTVTFVLHFSFRPKAKQNAT
jgi:hypothetical protein